MTLECSLCGAEFTRDVKAVPLAPVCPSCQEDLDAKADVRQERASVQRLDALWSRVCPSIFQWTEPQALPDQKAYSIAMAWLYNPIGLLLYGPPRTGKSRTAWLIAGREFYAGKKLSVIDALSAVEYAAHFSESAASVQRWIDKRLEADLLLLDDPFKCKLTDSYEAAMFGIIERRTTAGKPLIVTANDTAMSLSLRMSQDRAEPLVSRIREFCTSIEFRIAVEDDQTKNNG